MVKVLFVCMGNICRSPSAEGAFIRLIEQHALAAYIEVDSAGTHGYHIGEPADRRSYQAALKRGIDISPHRARQVTYTDFEYYDYILAMDMDNYQRLQGQCPEEHLAKVQLFLEYAPHTNMKEVPDPYYGGAQGFEHVLDLVEAAAEGLLETIKKERLQRA